MTLTSNEAIQVSTTIKSYLLYANLTNEIYKIVTTFHNVIDSASRATAPDSIGGKIPNKYYLVRNSEMVRVRYLLVYCQEVSSR